MSTPGRVTDALEQDSCSTFVQAPAVPANVCSTCNKAFSRVAHLKRHLASHDGPPRWDCQFCGSAFQRRDVLNRHLTTCSQAASGARIERRLVNRACNTCRGRKVRCDGDLPCARCVHANLDCTMSFRRERRRSTASVLRITPSPTPLPGNHTSQAENPNLSEAPQALISPVTVTNVPPDRLVVDPINRSMAIHRDPNAMGPSFSPVQEAEESWAAVDTLWNTDEAFDILQAFTWTTNGDNTMPYHSDHALNAPLQEGSMTARLPEQHESQPVALQPWTVASGLDLVQLDPLEHHRSRIVMYLQSQCTEVPEILLLFQTQSIGMIVNTYFVRHHRHTPIIHLPTWNIASCSTALILAMSLITASYTPTLGLRSSHIRPLLTKAYNFVIREDANLERNGPATLETLQALLLLVILERLMTPKQEHVRPVVALDNVVQLARAAGLFTTMTAVDPAPNGRWTDWVAAESARRLAFILYALDCLLTVLSDGVPCIPTYEMQLRPPHPEITYSAASETEWRSLVAVQNADNPPLFSVLMELLLSGLVKESEMPRTLMGRFVVMHGIFSYSWQARQQNLMARKNGNADTANQLFECRVREICRALTFCQEVWRSTAIEGDNAEASLPVLYRDRALVWLYLAGVFTISNCVISSPKKDVAPGGNMSICAFIRRLVTLLDQGQLEHLGLDYSAIQDVVTRGVTENEDQVCIGSLMYREPDAITPGFA